MPTTAVIVTHFGSSLTRRRLFLETVTRLLHLRGDRAIYLVENTVPGGPSAVPPQFADALTHLRVAGNPVLWQKEAMQNVGAGRALRDGAAELVFLDDDTLPPDADWLQAIGAALRENDWVHCGSQISYCTNPATATLLRDSWKESVRPDTLNFEGAIHHQLFSQICLRAQGIARQGFFGGSWACTRQAWERYRAWNCHNFIGGGDFFHFNRLTRGREYESHRIYGNLRALLFNPLLEEYARTDPAWRVGHIQATLYHLWHGSLSTRRYARRYRVLVRPQYWPLFRKEYPHLAPDQIIDIHSLLRTGEDGLLDLDPGHPYFEHVLVYLAHYLITRGELDLNTLNAYLECSGVPLRCTGRSGLSKLRRWVTRDLLSPVYPRLRGIGRVLPEPLRQKIRTMLQAIIESSSVVCVPTSQCRGGTEHEENR